MEPKYPACDGAITVVFGYSLARYIAVSSMPMQIKDMGSLCLAWFWVLVYKTI